MRADKSTYHVFQNVAWMCSLAWKHRRRVLFFCGLSAVLEILYQLIQLFLAPRILTLVEEAAALQTLLGTIALFTAALFALRFGRGYLEQIDLFARIDVRSVIIGLLGRKCNTTSYPNTLKPEFIKLRDVAHTASDGNQEATEQIWHTLTELCKNVGGFAVYLTILSHLDPILLLVTIATCLAGFWIARRTSGWMYRHRDEEEAYITRKRYIHRVAESVPVAKDIRIFGLQNWINDLYASVHDVYLAFRLRAEKVKLLAELTEAVLTMARNGIAYGYLIQMALLEHLSVGEFLLYFTAISTFTQWVMGILQASLKLHTQSLDISRVREFLDYPEPFRFSGGAALPDRRPYELRLEDVSFRYDGAETDTLRHLNLSIRPGKSWPLWASTARARPPWSSCCAACWTPPRAGFCSTASMCGSSTGRNTTASFPPYSRSSPFSM